MANRKIADFVGSLRKQSLNRNMAQAFMALAPASLEFDMLPIGQLPFYNQDRDDEGAPAREWSAFRDQVQGFDGVLFFTPEYNRSVPAVLKNALDVGSRPYGKSVWNGKPGAVVSVSPGAIGGFGANHHLRQSLVMWRRRTEAYIGGAAGLFDAEGRLANESTRTFAAGFMQKFAAWVEAHLPK